MYNVLAHIKFTSHDSGPLIAYDHFALYATREKKNVCGKNAHTDKIWFLSHSSSFYYSTFLTEFGTDIGYDLCCCFPRVPNNATQKFYGMIWSSICLRAHPSAAEKLALSKSTMFQ